MDSLLALVVGSTGGDKAAVVPVRGQFPRIAPRAWFSRRLRDWPFEGRTGFSCNSYYLTKSIQTARTGVTTRRGSRAVTVTGARCGNQERARDYGSSATVTGAGFGASRSAESSRPSLW